MEDDVEPSGRVCDAMGQIEIRLRGCGIARRVIVRKQKRGGAELKATFQDFARIGLDGRHSADSHDLVRQHLVCRVEKQHAKSLDRFIGHPATKIIEDRLVTGQHGAARELIAQHMIERELDRLQRLLDLRQAIEDWRAIFDTRGNHFAERSEAGDQSIRQILRPIRSSQTDQGFQGASAPGCVCRLFARHVATINISCANQPHRAVASI